jgi:hypothetical protein
MLETSGIVLSKQQHARLTGLKAWPMHAEQCWMTVRLTQEHFDATVV